MCKKIRFYSKENVLYIYNMMIDRCSDHGVCIGVRFRGGGVTSSYNPTTAIQGCDNLCAHPPPPSPNQSTHATVYAGRCFSIEQINNIINYHWCYTIKY